MTNKKTDIEAMKYMASLVDEFKEFVLDSIEDGYHENHADHVEFMKACMDTFLEMHQENGGELPCVPGEKVSRQ